MKQQKLTIGGVPALLWGEASEHCFMYVHGTGGYKEYAADFAAVAAEKGWQTLSFDLPEHGERKGDAAHCAPVDVIPELTTIADAVFAQFQTVSLFACSVGAYFSLLSYADRPFAQSLLQSPIADMRYLIGQMFVWFGVTPEQLCEKKRIETPFEVLDWDYYQYVLAHPIERWDIPTAILYAGKDNLQPESVIRAFAEAHGANLTVSPESEHPFMAKSDAPIFEHWLRETIPDVTHQ